MVILIETRYSENTRKFWNSLWLLHFLAHLKTSFSPDDSLRKQLTFHNASTGFPTKWPLRDECRNSILMMHHYPDLGSASDWLCHVGNLFQTIKSATQILVVTCHQWGISVLSSQTIFCGETMVASQNVGCFLTLTLCLWYISARHNYLPHNLHFELIAWVSVWSYMAGQQHHWSLPTKHNDTLYVWQDHSQS